MGEKKPSEEQDCCPFLRPVGVDELGTLPLGFWCALPRKGLRVAGRAELERFGKGGHHYDCPHYRGLSGKGSAETPAAPAPRKHARERVRTWS